MATSSKKHIEHDVMTVLKNSTITGNQLKLPPGQMERKLYDRVNKVLTIAGGKWNRSAAAHVFPKDPRDVLGMAMENGHIVDTKVENQQFFTPPAVAAMMVARIRKEPLRIGECTILEPSCGSGNLLRAVIMAGADPRLINAVEIDKELAAATKREFPDVHLCATDFLKLSAVACQDLVVMNPPFSKQQDIDHVTRALLHVKPRGQLLAIMSRSYQFSTTRKAVAFRELLAEHDVVETELPAGVFASSGTQVSTVMLSICKN